MMQLFCAPELLERIAEVPGGTNVIRDLLDADFRAAKFEALAHTKGRIPTCSVRANLSDRILLVPGVFDGRRCWILADVVLNHDYDKSKYVGRDSAKSIQRLIQALNSRALALVDFERLHDLDSKHGKLVTAAMDPEAIRQPLEIREVLAWQNQVLELNPTQSQALQVSLPLLLGGGPGSGKSCLSKQLIDALSASIETPDERVVYITRSSRLARKMEAEWVTQGGMETPHHHQVSFMTLEEFLDEEIWPAEHADRAKTRVDKTAFLDWWQARCQNKTLKRWKDESPDKIYQEFRLLSGYSREQYVSLGKKQSTYTEQRDREALYQAYEAYQAELERLKRIDINFYPLRGEKKYLLVIDEAMDLSNGILRALTRLAKDSQIVCCVDSNQSLEDDHSNRAFLLQMFREESGREDVSHLELPGSYRCPATVLRTAEALLAIKHAATGGLSDKHETHSLVLHDPATPLKEGSVTYVSPDADLAVYREKANSTQVAIVTEACFLEEAKHLFHTPLVFTPEEIKGLEYPTVITYKLLNHPVYETINKHVPDTELTASAHRAKAEDRAPEYGPPMNRIFTAVTRAQEELVVCQHFPRALKRIQHVLQSCTLQPTERPPVERAEAAAAQPIDLSAWQLEMLRQLDAGNRRQAIDIFVTKFHGTPADFDAFIATTQHPKQMPEPKHQPASPPQPVREKIPAASAPVTAPQKARSEPEKKSALVEKKKEKIPTVSASPAPSPAEPKAKSKTEEYLENLLQPQFFNKSNLEKLLDHAKVRAYLDTVLTFDGVTRTVYEHIVFSSKRLAIFLETLDSSLKYLDTVANYFPSKQQHAFLLEPQYRLTYYDPLSPEYPVFSRVLDRESFRHTMTDNEWKDFLRQNSADFPKNARLPLSILCGYPHGKSRDIERAQELFNHLRQPGWYDIIPISQLCAIQNRGGLCAPLISCLAAHTMGIEFLINCLEHKIGTLSESELIKLAQALCATSDLVGPAIAYVFSFSKITRIQKILDSAPRLYELIAESINQNIRALVFSQGSCMSTLFQLCCPDVYERVKILAGLIERKPDIAKQILPEALFCKRCLTRSSTGFISAFDRLILCIQYGEDKGIIAIKVLRAIFGANPALYSHVPLENLNYRMLVDDPSIQSKSALESLLTADEGIAFLETLMEHNPACSPTIRAALASRELLAPPPRLPQASEAAPAPITPQLDLDRGRELLEPEQAVLDIDHPEPDPKKRTGY